MNTLGYFRIIFLGIGALLILACLVCAVVFLFGMRGGLEGKLRGLPIEGFEKKGILHRIWDGLKLLSASLLVVVFLIGTGLWSLLAYPFRWSWYRMSGKPMPTPERSAENIIP